MNTRRTTTPKSVQASRLNRRDFLIRGGLMGAGALSLPALLAACGSDSGSTSDTVGGGGGDGSLFFENWPGYMDEETIGLFQTASGISLKYTEAFNDNNEYFAKIQPAMSKGNAIEPDILAPTFWMAARLLQLGWVQKLPKADIPNFVNLRDDLSGQSWDKNDEYHLPYQSGIAGIAYNSKITGRELKSVADLFDPAFKGKIGMLTEMRDTIGLILMGEGKKIADITTFDQASVAFDKLGKAKSEGQIRSFTGNDYVDDLSAGNFAACVAWSGDVLQLTKDNPDVKFIVPEEGGTSWYDTMVWMKGSENGDAVAKWMNFLYDPVNAARLTAFVQYISPVKGVQDELANMGGDNAKLAEDPLLFPDTATFARLQSWGALAEEEEAKFDEAFASVTGA
jgi:spermidine/putrescine transport system substrate-binding protein